MRGVRNLRVPVEQLRSRLQRQQGAPWSGPDSPKSNGEPHLSGARLQLVRSRVLANARQAGRRTLP